MNTSIQEILSFWFGNDPAQPMAHQSLWWKKDPQIDQKIKNQFEKQILAAKKNQFEEWQKTPEGSLALVILLDQFSRNIYRDSPQAFSQDGQALKISFHAIELGHDKSLSPEKRWFLYMPMMHSEDPEIQKQSLEKFEELLSESPPNFKKSAQSALDYAKRHAEIVFRFGRYPHRNSILSRESTPEELEFLKTPGSSF